MKDWPVDRQGWPQTAQPHGFAGADPMEREIGGAGRPQTRLSLALAASARTRGRLQRMKMAAGQARAATGGFPYPHRNLAQITEKTGW